MFYQTDLPIATSLFYLFFSNNRICRIIAGFKPDKVTNVISGGEAAKPMSPMLINAAPRND